MTTPDGDRGKVAAPTTVLAAWQRFLEKPRPIALPLAQSADTAIESWSHDGASWLVTSPSCSCTSHLTSASPRQAHDALPKQESTVIDVHFEGSLAGRIAVCSGPSQATLHESFRQLIESTIRGVELERENESLLEELGTSCESLEAVSDISSDLRLLLEPKDLLDRITGKAVAIQEGLQAILWPQQGGQLEPIAQESNAEAVPRALTEGLIGRVLREHHGMVLNGCESITASTTIRPSTRAVPSRGYRAVAVSDTSGYAARRCCTALGRATASQGPSGLDSPVGATVWPTCAPGRCRTFPRRLSCE